MPHGGSWPARASHRPRRAHNRRAETFGETIGLTALGAALPGAGYIAAGRRRLGYSVLGLVLLMVSAGLALATIRPASLLQLAFDPGSLGLVATILLLLLAGWATVVVTGHRMVRPLDATVLERVSGGLFVGALCFALAVPMMVGARYALVQRDLVNTVFISSHSSFSATRPERVTPEDPWSGAKRVNVLLLGGDGDVQRFGIRTDTVILASIQTGTGDTTLISLPRNLEEVPFREGTRLDTLYPRGFTGPGDPLEWMLNAVYQHVPELHPRGLGRTDNPGADAVKLAVGGALGVPVDYYVLINLDGFQRLVDAMGGITVNVNEPVPIGGNTDLGIPPEGYIQPGADKHLDGFEALWFARGRYGSDDYERMDRQRCAVDAIIDQADPATLLTRYEQIAAAGREVVRTDIPGELLPAFVHLALDVKDANVHSVVFRRTDRFYPEDPDYQWVRRVVDRALHPERSMAPAGSGAGDPGPGGGGPGGVQVVEEPGDSCDYHPVAG